MKTFSLFLFFLTTTVFAQNSFDIMSYNIRYGTANDGENSWDFRKTKVVNLLNYYEASFIGLQEVQKLQLDFILQNSPSYSFVGLPRDAANTSEYSCILYNKNNYKVLENKTLWLSATPELISIGWDASMPRIVTYGLFQNIKSKKKFWVVNTHFDHEGKIARLESAKMILKLHENLKKKQAAPFILLGDFNGNHEEESVQILSKAFNEAHSNSENKPYGGQFTWNAFEFNKPLNRQIDFIFFDKNSSIKVRKFITIDDFYDFKYPSDHLPIMATFTERL